MQSIDASWQTIIQQALSTVEPHYMEQLHKNPNWLPGQDKIFNAFSLPLAQTEYILFGESPYPRAESANGYAFWDANVGDIWTETGLSKPVNRATSLRNILKMLLVADNQLMPSDTSQAAIAKTDKSNYIHSLAELFENMQRHGILLLNASLVLSQNKVQYDAKHWRPFMAELLQQIALTKPDIKLILLGNIAKEINKFTATKQFDCFYSEHPYNVSFINNPQVLEFFGPFHLLEKS
ncbi:MAG: uracil-DNA glycosylase [Legionellales bacterium]|nr:uracil-DNA glycosylase [Legionellales bacterium]